MNLPPSDYEAVAVDLKLPRRIPSVFETKRYHFCIGNGKERASAILFRICYLVDASSELTYQGEEDNDVRNNPG